MDLSSDIFGIHLPSLIVSTERNESDYNFCFENLF